MECKQEITTIRKSTCRPGRVVSVLMLIGACGLAYWLAFISNPAKSATAGLFVEDRYLNFGTVWEQNKLVWRFPIQNKGFEEIEVVSFKTSCSCIAIEPKSFKLFPGEVRELALSLNVTRRPNSPEAEEFKASFSPEIKGASGIPVGWTLKGRVRALLKLSSPIIQFGDLDKNLPWPTKPITVSAALDLDDLKVVADLQRVRFQTKKVGQKEFEVLISLEPILGAGPFRLDISLHPVVEGKQLPGKRITLAGLVHEDVELLPSKVLLGAMLIGNKATQTVVLTSRSGRGFEVKEWKSLSETLQIEPIGESRSQFRVTQRIQEPGTQQVLALFKVHTHDSHDLEVPLNVFYYGVLGQDEK